MSSGKTLDLGTWPPISYEKLPWKSKYEQGIASRNAIRKNQGPYSAAVTNCIAKLNVHLAAELLAILDEASSEIARFDQQMGGEFAPFTAILLRTESAASSQIEKLNASARAVGEAELSGFHSRTNASLVVSNGRAMNAAVELSSNLSTDAVLKMHAALLSNHDPKIAGVFRTEPVWIGGSALGPHQAMFVPPHHSRVAGAIEDLVTFIKRNDLPVLVQAALAHAQFETIHPFVDGNGRTGRALIHALLRNKSLTRNLTLPVSAGLLVDVNKYFDALGSYRLGDINPIVNRLAEASFNAVYRGRKLVTGIREIRSAWNDSVKARKGSNTWRIADLFITRPVLNAIAISTELGIDIRNLYAPLEPLLAAGIISVADSKHRNMIWYCNEILEMLDAFTAESGKRNF